VTARKGETLELKAPDVNEDLRQAAKTFARLAEVAGEHARLLEAIRRKPDSKRIRSRLERVREEHVRLLEECRLSFPLSLRTVKHKC
jgi:hypothetical protein